MAVSSPGQIKELTPSKKRHRNIQKTKAVAARLLCLRCQKKGDRSRIRAMNVRIGNAIAVGGRLVLGSAIESDAKRLSGLEF